MIMLAIPRHRIFVLRDGSFVVQWEENRVQDLLSGKYRLYSQEDYASAVTDYELSQLQGAHIVSEFNDELVYVRNAVERQDQSIRSYYINTSLDESYLVDVQERISVMGLNGTVRLRRGFIVIWGAEGRAFHSFDEAEKIRETLLLDPSDIFSKSVVAFIEDTKSSY
ncbi:hypothetical protein MASR2M15_12190 [Anaerolineales bacterium]